MRTLTELRSVASALVSELAKRESELSEGAPVNVLVILLVAAALAERRMNDANNKARAEFAGTPTGEAGEKYLAEEEELIRIARELAAAELRGDA